MLFEQVSNDIKEAMKARDKVRLETLRNIKKVFLEAKTAPGANDTLEDADALEAAFQAWRSRARSRPSRSRRRAGKTLPTRSLAQVAVIEEYLPKPLTEAEIEAAVKDIIAQTGATGMKDMGRVMGTATKQMAGRADGGVISGIVKRLLA